MSRRYTPLLLALATLLAPAFPARAERAWVKDELTIWVRSGAGNQYRNFQTLKTGDSVEIVSRRENWTEVRGKGGMQGWIPVGYLQSEPPARIRLERFEAETAELRTTLDKLTREAEELRARNERLDSTEGTLKAQLERVERENMELRAGARWPEWFAGASILLVGCLLGIFVHRSSSRRTTRRIRL